MLRLIRWLIGYVKFGFVSGFADGFVNDCYQNKFNVKNIEIKGGNIVAECPAPLYPYLRKTAKKNGGRLKTIEKHGLIFCFSGVKNRWGLFVGIVLGICFISYVSGFIWSIDITGNKRLGENEIRSFLSANGFCEGTRWKDVDKDKIENLLLASYDDCAFAHINRYGTHAVLEIDEAVIKPKTVNRKKRRNLVAKKDGVIIKDKVYDGWKIRKKGDAVTKGELLISGTYSGDKKVRLYAHARGEYIARVKEDFSLTVSRNQSVKEYLSVEERKTLLFFGLKIPLYLSKTPKNAEVQTEDNYLNLNGESLPVGIRKTQIKTYKNKVITLNDSELTSLIESEINKKLKDDFGEYKIIKKKIKIKLNENTAEAKGYVICHENIGKEVKMKR